MTGDKLFTGKNSELILPYDVIDGAETGLIKSGKNIPQTVPPRKDIQAPGIGEDPVCFIEPTVCKGRVIFCRYLDVSFQHIFARSVVIQSLCAEVDSEWRISNDEIDHSCRYPVHHIKGVPMIDPIRFERAKILPHSFTLPH